MSHEIHCPLADIPDEDGMDREFVDEVPECCCKEIQEAADRESKYPERP